MKLKPSEQPIVETIVAAGLIAARVFLLPEKFEWWDQIDPSHAQTIYQTGAGVVAVIAALAALGLATGGAGDRAKEMRAQHGAALRRNWRALLLTSAVAPMLAIVAQVSAAAGAGWAPYPFEFALLWTSLRLARLAWLVDGLLKVQIQDETAPDPIGKMALTPDFQRNTGTKAS